MEFSKTRKLEIRKKWYNILSQYKGYYFVTDDDILYICKEEIDWDNMKYKVKELTILRKYVSGIPSYLMGSIDELLSQLVIVKNPKKVL